MATTPRKALNNILDYIGGCESFRDNAQLITYIEWAATEATKSATPSGQTELALLSVERNYCDCHPDTCSCDDWRLMYDGEELARNHDKAKLDKLIKIMRNI